MSSKVDPFKLQKNNNNNNQESIVSGSVMVTYMSWCRYFDAHMYNCTKLWIWRCGLGYPQRVLPPLVPVLLCTTTNRATNFLWPWSRVRRIFTKWCLPQGVWWGSLMVIIFPDLNLVRPPGAKKPLFISAFHSSSCYTPNYCAVSTIHFEGLGIMWGHCIPSCMHGGWPWHWP